MATRIENIITRVRDTLSDPDGDRWSTPRLLRLVDEAQKDLAKQSKLLKGTTDLFLAVDQAEYDLPEDLWLITRASFNDYEIPLYSYDNMDEQAKKEILQDRRYDYAERRKGYGSNIGDSYGRIVWETTTGPRIEALIYDNREVDTIRVYPIPNDEITDSAYTFENVDGVPFVGAEVYGLAVDIDDYTVTSIYGCTTDLFDPQIANEVFNSAYGVISDISESTAVVKIWYIRLAATVESVLDDLEMPRMFDVAIKHYVIGNALRDDIDEQYRQMGAESLQMYDREIDLAKSTEASDGTRSATNYATTYRGGFE